MADADRNEALRLADALEQYNAWRRGGDGEQPDPSRLGAEIEAAAALLRRLAEMGQAPEGWQLVPKDATLEMEQAFEFAHHRADFRPEAYLAMLAAAPSPKEQS